MRESLHGQPVMRQAPRTRVSDASTISMVSGACMVVLLSTDRLPEVRSVGEAHIGASGSSRHPRQHGQRHGFVGFGIRQTSPPWARTTDLQPCRVAHIGLGSADRGAHPSHPAFRQLASRTDEFRGATPRGRRPHPDAPDQPSADAHWSRRGRQDEARTARRTRDGAHVPRRDLVRRACCCAGPGACDAGRVRSAWPAGPGGQTVDVPSH